MFGYCLNKALMFTQTDSSGYRLVSLSAVCRINCEKVDRFPWKSAYLARRSTAMARLSADNSASLLSFRAPVDCTNFPERTQLQLYA